MDNLVFEESVNAEIDQSEFISKKWIYVNDTNSQNYTSQIIIDSTPLANAGGYINWQEAYILMPLVVTLAQSATDVNKSSIGVDGNSQANHSWAFRAGFWHMINSMTVEFNNQNIVQQTPFLNVFRSFKAHTSFSQDDVLNEGYTIGYHPDTAGSWGYSTAYGSNGIGLTNNKQMPFYSVPLGANATSTVAYPVSAFNDDANPSPAGWGSEYSQNSGFAKRSDWYGYSPSSVPASVMGQSLINSSSTANTVYRAYRLPNVGALAGQGLNDDTAGWSIIAKLRLKDLSDYFQKCPLLKGSTIRFLINTNQSTTTFRITGETQVAATGVITPAVYSNTSSQVLGGLTNPLMLASADVGQGCSSLVTRVVGGAANVGNFTLKCSIFKDTSLGTQSALSSCRLYAPVYKMNPLAEQRYLSLAPTKKIEYTDIFQYQFSNIGANDTFNVLVTNGIQNIQSVLVVPFLSPADNGAIQPTLSPFSASGATPDPITLTNFNILVSGVNLFLNNELYDFEQFNQELKSSNQLNGSLTTGLASGLISEDMFSRGYRYYYGNCARILPSEEGVSRSIQIIGQNVSLKSCSLMVFVEFKRSMVVDISTGARVE
jgi:hypothetical protein